MSDLEDVIRRIVRDELGRLSPKKPANVTRSPQRNWWQIRNEDDGEWTVIDHVATRQRADVLWDSAK